MVEISLRCLNALPSGKFKGLRIGYFDQNPQFADDKMEVLESMGSKPLRGLASRVVLPTEGLNSE